MIIGSFNKDFFVTTTHKNPRIVITQGMEDRVFINGQSVASLAQNTSPIAMAVNLDVSTIAKQRPSPASSIDASIVPVRSKDDPYVPSPSTMQVVYYDVSTNTIAIPITPSYSTKTIYTDPEGSYRDSKLEKILRGTALPNKYGVFEKGLLYHIHIESNEDCYVNLIDVSTNTSGGYDVLENNGCQYYAETQENIDKYINYGKTKKMLGDDVSYTLLRANPKLTGNIKVVVDSDSNLYIDTFKVSNALSQSKYRKIKVNPNEYYGRTIMSVFNGMTSDDLYKIEDSCYKLFSTANNLGEQYYDKYNCGVRTNGDNIYPENFALLAPLCIKKIVPDFFVVFKIKDYENVTGIEKIKYFLQNGEIVKVYDMRKDSPLGKYVRNIQKHSKDFVGDIYVSYDYEKDNIFNGISLERGVVSSIHESASLERNIKNQVALNDWYTLGFERNRIVSKDIVNFEFMFDDTEEKLFSLNTYFGLYIRLNGESETFTCIGSDGNEIIFDSSISGKGTSVVSDIKELIYGISTKYTFIRLGDEICNHSNYDLLKNFILKPDKNITSPDIINYPEDYYNRCYASVKLYEPLEPGEHYRIVDTINHKIFEVIASDVNNDDFDISEINYRTDASTGYDIESVSIYNLKHRSQIDADSYDSVIDDEVVLIRDAFNKFESDKVISYSGDKSFSLIYDETFEYGSENYVLIEKVSSYHAIDSSENSVIGLLDDKSFDLLGEMDVEPIELNIQEDNSLFTRILYPSGFEVLGTRVAYCSLFIPLENNNLYKAYLIETDVTNYLNPIKTVLYRSKNGYSLFEGFQVYSLKADRSFKVRDIKDVPGFGNSESYLIRLKDEPLIVNGKLCFYTNYPLNAGVCSIFSVKDFCLDVLDNVNTIWTTTPTKKIPGSSPGRYALTDNVTKTSIQSGTEERITSYLDKYERYSVYDSSTISTNFVEDEINVSTLPYYLSMMSNDDHKSSDISLIAPYCCKWRHVGTDYTGLPLRVMYNLATADVNSSYFLSDDSSGYIGALAADSSENSEKYVGVRLSNPSDGKITNNMFFGNGTVDELITNDAIEYLASVDSYGKDEVTFIYGGVQIKISCKQNNIVDLSKYKNYKSIMVCCMKNNPKRSKGSDILIDEVNERIVVLYYTGTDDISYNEFNSKVKYDTTWEEYNGIIDPVFRTLRYLPLTETEVEYIGGEKRILVTDDASYYNNTELYRFDEYVVTTNSYIFLTSSKVDSSAYTLEKYNLVVGKLYGTKGRPYNSLYPNYIVSNDGSIFSNSVAQRIDNFNISTELKKKYEVVDGFVVSRTDDKSVYTEIFEDRIKKTPILEKVKGLLSDPNVYIKKAGGTLDYTNVSDLIKVEVVEPITFKRENSEFEEIRNSGKVYPGSASPLMKNMINFDNGSLNIDLVGSAFGKNFENSNIIVKNNETITQTWLRKYSVNKLSSITDGSTSYIRQYNVKSLMFPNVSGLYLPLYKGMPIKQTVDGEETTYIIESVENSEEYNGYTCKITGGRVVDASLAEKIRNGETIDITLKNIIFHTKKEISQQEVEHFTSYHQIISLQSALTFASATDPETSETYYYISSDSSILFSHENDNYEHPWIESYSVSWYSIDIYDENTGAELIHGCRPVDLELASPIIETKYYITDRISNYNLSKDKTYIYIRSKDFNDFEGPVFDKTRYVPGPEPYTINNVAEMVYQQPTNSEKIYVMDASVERPYKTISEISENPEVIEYTVGIDAVSGINPLNNCWQNNIYRTYYNFDDYNSELGIDSGYEMNNYIASRGINLNGIYDGSVIKTIILDEWVDSIVNESEKKITLDITSSLINKILFSEGYSENWENKNIQDVKNKSKYINNSILKYIRINNKCKVSVYKVKGTYNLSIFDNSEDLELNEVQNISNYLYKDGDSYYMDFENLENSGYVVKFEIEL